MYNLCFWSLNLISLQSFTMFPQNTVVVERWWQVPLSKVGSPPRLHPRRHRIYKVVEDTTHSPKEKMELILTQTVPSMFSTAHLSLTFMVSKFSLEVKKKSVFKIFSLHQQTSFLFMYCFLTGLGGRGDTVFVKRSVGRNKLLAQGLAAYPSPENKQLFAEELRVCIALQYLHYWLFTCNRVVSILMSFIFFRTAVAWGETRGKGSNPHRTTGETPLLRSKAGAFKI